MSHRHVLVDENSDSIVGRLLRIESSMLRLLRGFTLMERWWRLPSSPFWRPCCGLHYRAPHHAHRVVCLGNPVPFGSARSGSDPMTETGKPMQPWRLPDVEERRAR